MGGGLTLAIAVTSTAVAAPIEVATGSLISYLYSIPIPNEFPSNRYVAPSAGDQNSFREATGLALAGRYQAAADAMDALNYRTILFLDTGEGRNVYHLVFREKDTGQKFRGTFALRLSPGARNLVIESPHPLFDGVHYQAIDLYVTTESLGFMQSGTHRRNHLDNSPCDGTFTDGSPYRISDMAHNVDSYFQAFHEVLSDTLTGSLLVSVHGMALTADPADVVLSNGTTGDEPATSMSRRLSDEMNTILALAGDTRYTVSHQTPGVVAALPGGTNKQGRYTNGSANPCFGSLARAPQPERFIHMEQKSTVRGGTDRALWSFVQESFNALVPAAPAIAPGPGGVPMLAAQWTFDDTSNDVVGGLAAQLTAGMGYATGAFGDPMAALAFNGSTDVATLPDLDYTGADGSFTVALWMRAAANGNTFQYLFSHGTVAVPAADSPSSPEAIRFLTPASLHVYLNSSNGQLRVRMATQQARTVSYNGPTGLINGEWRHVAVGYDFTEGLRVWVDGVRVHSDATVAGDLFDPEGNIVLGHRSDLLGDRRFGSTIADRGLMDDVRLYNYLLSDEQVLELLEPPVGAVGPSLWRMF
jgi:hypothetical protein